MKVYNNLNSYGGHEQYMHQLSDNYYRLEEISEIQLLNEAYLHLFNWDKCIQR